MHGWLLGIGVWRLGKLTVPGYLQQVKTVAADVSRCRRQNRICASAALHHIGGIARIEWLQRFIWSAVIATL